MFLKCGVGEDSWESLDCDEIQLVHPKGNQSWIHWKDLGWSWNSNTLATWCKELTHWKRPWCWERLSAGGEEGNRGWDSWMASLTQWTWVWVSSRSWWWTGKPGVLQSMGSQRVGHNWATELNWTELNKQYEILFSFMKIISTQEETKSPRKGFREFVHPFCPF